MFHLIRKYSNRKLYDTFQKKFITLDELITLLLEHADIRIEDSDTKIDITDLEVSKAIIRFINDGNDLPDSLRHLLTIIDDAKDKKKPSRGYSLSAREETSEIDKLDDSSRDVLSYVPAEIRLLNKSMDYLRGAINILGSETPFNTPLHHELYVLYKEFDRKLTALKRKFRIN